MLFEVEVGGRKTIRPHILRGVNHKDAWHFHAEIRAFQAQSDSGRQESRFIDRFVRLPGFAWWLSPVLSVDPPSSDQSLLRHRDLLRPSACLARAAGGAFRSPTTPCNSPWAGSAANRAWWRAAWRSERA